jgi:hypothetical protein
MKRTGNDFGSFWSYDGVEWREVPGSRRTFALPGQALVGFAHVTGAPGARFEAPTEPWQYNVIHLRHLGEFTAVARPLVTVSREGANVVLSWQNGGVLERSGTVSGPWHPTGDTSGTATLSLEGAAAFFRVRL